MVKQSATKRTSLPACVLTLPSHSVIGIYSYNHWHTHTTPKYNVQQKWRIELSALPSITWNHHMRHIDRAGDWSESKTQPNALCYRHLPHLSRMCHNPDKQLSAAQHRYKQHKDAQRQKQTTFPHMQIVHVDGSPLWASNIDKTDVESYSKLFPGALGPVSLPPRHPKSKKLLRQNTNKDVFELWVVSAQQLHILRTKLSTRIKTQQLNTTNKNSTKVKEQPE